MTSAMARDARLTPPRRAGARRFAALGASALFGLALLLQAITVSAQTAPEKPNGGDAPASSAAPAEDPGSAKGQARVRLERGIKFYKDGRFKDAIDEFMEAHRLYPSPVLSFNAARAYEKMGDSAGALRFYREYVRQSPEAPDRAAVERKVSDLERELQAKGVQQVTVLSTPEGATVSVDGKPIGVTPWTGQLYPGRHALLVERDGFEDARSDFELLAHRSMDVRVALRRVEPASPATAAPAASDGAEEPKAAALPQATRAPAREPQRRGGAPRPWTWAVLGAGAATLGAAAVFEGLRRVAEDDVRSESEQLDRHEAFQRMEKRRDAARVLAITGAGVTFVGGVLLMIDLTSPRGRSSARASAHCGPALCGLEVVGRF